MTLRLLLRILLFILLFSTEKKSAGFLAIAASLSPLLAEDLACVAFSLHLSMGVMFMTSRHIGTTP